MAQPAQYPLYPGGNATFPSDATLPMSVSDWSKAEMAAVCVVATALGLTACGFAFLNYHRNVKYVKIMGVAYLNAFFLLTCAYWFAILTSTRLIPQTGAFLICVLWNVWVWFGSLTLFLTLHILRMWRLDLILIQRRPARGWRLYLPPTLAWLPMFTYTIACTVLDGDGPFVFTNFPSGDSTTVVTVCYLQDFVTYSGIVHLVVLALIYIGLVVRLRRSRSQIFMEYTQSVASFVMFIASVIVYSIIVLFNYTYTNWGRAVVVFLIGVDTILYQWIFIGIPVYNLLFRHEQALLDFQQIIANRKIVVDSSQINSSSRGGTGTGGHRRHRSWWRSFFSVNTSSRTDNESSLSQLDSGGGGAASATTNSITMIGKIKKSGSSSSGQGHDSRLDAEIIISELATGSVLDLDAPEIEA